MSKLQKKKPQNEKRKRVSEGERKTNVAVKSTTAGKEAQSASVSTAKTDKSVVQSEEDNLFKRTAEFFREVKVELKKVVWPTRKQTSGTTMVVIIFVFVVAVFLGIFDYSLSSLVQVVLT
jgi:preprotein translocase subunit SecE